MAESLCGICGIDAARVLMRGPGGAVAVPAQTVRDGHVMVVSASHAAAFGDLTPSEAGALMALVGEAARSVEAASGGRCYVLRIGDVKRHVHFHIVPVAEGDPPLAPFVFGADGWAAGATAGALPAMPVFEPAFAAGMREAIGRVPANAGRLPPALVSLAITLLALAVALPVTWALIGPPWAGPVAVGAALAAGRMADDRMKGVPVRSAPALVFGAAAAAVYYFMLGWLQSRP